MGAAICSAYPTKYSTILLAGAKPSGSTSVNVRVGNRSCQAGPLATSESHLSERQRSAIRDRSRMRCGIARWRRWPLIASPAWPPPTMSVSIFSTDMVGAASPGALGRCRCTAVLFIGQAGLRKILFIGQGIGFFYVARPGFPNYAAQYSTLTPIFVSDFDMLVLHLMCRPGRD